MIKVFFKKTVFRFRYTYQYTNWYRVFVYFLYIASVVLLSIVFFATRIADRNTEKQIIIAKECIQSNGFIVHIFSKNAIVCIHKDEK